MIDGKPGKNRAFFVLETTIAKFFVKCQSFLKLYSIPNFNIQTVLTFRLAGIICRSPTKVGEWNPTRLLLGKQNAFRSYLIFYKITCRDTKYEYICCDFKINLLL